MSSNIPNLFVIGAAKSGTTTLYSILSKHPQIFVSSKKSPRFFLKDELYNRGLNWYIKTYFEESKQFSIRAEATPSYLANAEITASRIKETLGSENLRFIAIFRNPVERAYSHYWYNVNKKYRGQESLSFEDAIQFEQKHKASMENIGRESSHTRDYFKNGEYSRCLMEYFKYFKRDQFFLLLLEDLHKEKFEATTTQITNFLGVDNISISYTKENQSRKIGSRSSVQFIKKQRGVVKFLKTFLPQPLQDMFRSAYSKMILQPISYPPMKNSTRELLLKKYMQSIIELEEIMGRDLSYWKK